MSAERLQKLLAVLPSSDLPADLAGWLADGMQEYQRGAELEQALKLASDDTMTLDERDELLRTVLDLSPGESMAARCCYVLDCMDGSQHSNKLASRLILRLRRSRIRLPRDARQLRRIMSGYRCEDSFR